MHMKYQPQNDFLGRVGFGRVGFGQVGFGRPVVVELSFC
jgi:hypothetical protein